MHSTRLQRKQAENESEVKRTRSRHASIAGVMSSALAGGPPVMQLGSSSSDSARVQTKLEVSRPGDRYEQEADRIAEHVMSMHPDAGPASSAVAAGLLGPSLQRKPDGDQQTSSAQPSFLSSLGSGQPLDRSTREFFESRFGSDLNEVRIHDGAEAAESARELNARAYTVGRDVVFGPGQYQPHTSNGRELLAHELTHTLQQRSEPAPSIQRRVEVDPGLTLDTKGFNFTKTGDTYTCPTIVKNSVWNEIFTALLHSPRIFKVEGTTDEKMNANFRKHMAARLGVIEFASHKKYRFGAGSRVKMNPKYWVVDHANNKFDVKPGVNRAEAIADLNKTPTEYVLGCEMATFITMVGGSKSAVINDLGIGPDDWIPGEAGWIKNTNFPTDGTGVPGLEGENLIYTGNDKFWGHFTAKNEYKSLQEWFDQVEGWDGAAAIQTYRTRPVLGLKR